MLPTLILAAALASAPPSSADTSPLSDAIEQFRTVETYQVTIRSTHAEGEEHIHYYYKKPGFVRMEFVQPHAGAVMIFNPETKRVRLWPFGMGNFPELNLSPDNSIIRSLSGMRIDHSDVGTLFANILALRKQGDIAVLGEEAENERAILHFIVTGGNGVTVAGVHSSEVWLDEENQFPIKVISRDIHGAVIESVRMEALEINGKLPETLFYP